MTDAIWESLRPPYCPVKGYHIVKKLLPPLEDINKQKRLWPDCYSDNETAKFSGHRNNQCHNCGLSTHRFAECIGPLCFNRRFLGCPIHGTRWHSFDECWHPKAHAKESLELYLVFKRRGKTMLDSEHYDKVEIDWNLLPIYRPLTATEVMQQKSRIALWKEEPYHLDLYNYGVADAIQELDKRIKEIQHTEQTHLYVIVGRGKHSKRHIPKIKPAAKKFCEEQSLPFEVEDNEGMICIFVQRYKT